MEFRPRALDDMVGTSLNGRSVLVTGHTGFKGAWLSLLLSMQKARVSGLSFDVETPRPLHALISDPLKDDLQLDIRDAPALAGAIERIAPEVVFHMAAQPLVRDSYRVPLETWTTNVIGTANLLEACRKIDCVKAVVVVTTDKCYENREWLHPYREIDRLGGHDPYSASKACTEILTASYRASYLKQGGVGLATARAGNVIGGGDFATDRLIPDAVRAFTADKPLVLRNPLATRPWQHVLEPLSGYLLLAGKLLSEPAGAFDTAWNFGPDADGNASVGSVAERFAALFGKGHVESLSAHSEPHEAGFLQLDSSRAKALLGWRTRWSLDEALQHAADWYRAWSRGEDIAKLMQRQIGIYFAD